MRCAIAAMGHEEGTHEFFTFTFVDGSVGRTAYFGGGVVRWMVLPCAYCRFIGAVSFRTGADDERENSWFWFAATYVTAACASLLVLPSCPLPAAFGEGFPLMVALITLVWVNDTAAYVGGKAIGGARLMPTISPKKTWAGLIVSLIVATAYGAAFIAYVSQKEQWGVALASAFICAVVAHVGDAGESIYKRRVDVKDSGALLPGHGGVLDRFDSLYGVALVSFVLLTSLR